MTDGKLQHILPDKNVTDELIRGFHFSSCNIINGQMLHGKCLRTDVSPLSQQQNGKYRKTPQQFEKFITFDSFSKYPQVSLYFTSVFKDLGITAETGKRLTPQFEVNRQSNW